MQYKSTLHWFYRVGDAVFIVIVLYFALFIYGLTWEDKHTIISLLSVTVFSLICQYWDLYEVHRLSRRSGEYYIIIKGWVWYLFILMILIFISKKSYEFSRFVITLWVVLVPVILISYRCILKELIKKVAVKFLYLEKIAIIGEGHVFNSIEKNLNENKFSGYDLAYKFKTEELEKCIKLAKELNFHKLFIAIPSSKEKLIFQLINELSDSAVAIEFAPDLLNSELLYSSWYEINGTLICHLNDTVIRGMPALLKRTMDIILSALILFLISPLLLLLSCAIKFTSKGPILFIQTRYGLCGTSIKVWKFRTMTVCEDGDITQAKKHDARITKLGFFCRRTSLDELPQFINVLLGSMSIVGPRPHAVVHNEEFRKIAPFYMRRHLVKPGITGWAQVNGWRGETDSIDKILKRTEFDLYYLKHWTIWLDIRIIFKTIAKVLYDKNAH